MRTLFALLTFTMVFAVVSGAEATNKNKGESAVMLKAVIHVNFADSERQENALGNIDNILKEVPAAQIEVICHGNGINLVVAKDVKHSEKITALMTQGVHFVACENTMKRKAITKDELAAGVTTVPSGAVEVLRKQQEGYGYFRP